MRLIFLLLSSILFIMLLSFCSDYDSRNTAALIIENKVFDREDHRYFLQRESQRNNDFKISDLKEKEITILNNEFLESSLVLTGAYHQGFEKNELINNSVEQMARYMLLRPKGFVYNELILKKSKVSQEMIDEAEQKRWIDFDLQIIQFTTEFDFRTIGFEDTLFSSKKSFDALWNVYQDEIDISHRNLKWNWTSRNYLSLRDQIFAMSEGEIKVFSTNSYNKVVIRVAKKRAKKSGPKVNKINVMMLHRLEIARLAEEFDKKVHTEAKIAYFFENSETFWQRIAADSIDFFDINKYESFKTIKLAEFLVNRKKVVINGEKIMKYYNNLPIKRTLKNKSIFYYYIQDFAWEKNVLKLAGDKGIDKTERFTKEKKFYKEKLMAKYYISSKLHSISEKDLLEIYKKNREKYNLGEYVQVTLLNFKSKIAAQNGIRFLTDNIVLNKGYLRLPGLISYKERLKIHYSDTNYPEDLVNKMFSSNSSVSQQPFKISDDNFLVFKQEGKFGKRYQTFNAVRDELYNKLYTQKYNAAKKQLSDSLKTVFTVRNYLDY